MAEVASAPAAAQDKQEEANPFAGFVTEEYVGGQRVADPPQPKPVDEPKKEEPQPKESDESTEQAPQGEEVAPDDTAPGDDGAQRPKSVQERINEITRQRHDERRRAEAAEERTKQLEAEIERLRTGAQPEPPAKAPVATGAQEGEPSPDDFEYGELDSRYIAALVAFNTKQAIAAAREEDRQEREKTAAEAKQKERHTAFVKRAESGAAKKYPDFVEKVFGGIDTYPMSQETAEVVLESPVGDEVAYHLATHVDEAWKLYQMPPMQQARYLGMLEARFSASGSAAPAGAAAEEIPATKTPQAPAPVLPARGAGGKFASGADTDDFAAFERRMNQG